MKGFLDIVADKVVEKFKSEISDYTFVLPGKRAYLLLKEKIANRITTPCWEPQYTTLTVLASESSNLLPAEDIVLLSLLFSICKENLDSDFFAEDFESFVSWGEILINDFSGIDNNMVDAEKLFSNISDFAEIDLNFHDEGIDYRLQETLKHHTHPKDAIYRKEFDKIWNRLFDIYISFRKQLLQKGIGYPGMINRKAADEAKESDKKYIFVGFNTFNQSEYKFVKKIKPREIYWDSCHFFDDNRTNSLLNPDSVPTSDQKIGCEIEEAIGSDELNGHKIEIIKCPTDVIQCKVVMKRLEKMDTNHSETAIVLADDNILPVMLQSIPQNINDINITTGLPALDSSVFVFYKHLESIIINQTKGFFRREDVIYFLSNPIFSKLWSDDKEILDFKSQNENNVVPYINVSAICNPSFKRFFVIPEKNKFSIGEYLINNLVLFSELSQSDEITEIAIRMSKCIKSLNLAISRYNISVTDKLFLRILERNLSRSYTPYLTESTSGIQVTGILETRCQDFKNVFILSANDDTLPKKSQFLSFIPMNLRKAYNLPCSGDFQRMSASYFYHLLMRAENIYILYNGTSAADRTGEVSRFVKQIEYLTPKNTQISYTSTISKLRAKDNIELDFHHSQKSRETILNTHISASLLNTYLRCQRQFVLKYIYKIKPQEIIEENINTNDYGLAVHSALENICKKDVYNNKEAERLLDNFNNEVLPIIRKFALEENIYKKYPHKIGSTEMINLEKMICIWVKNVLQYDATRSEKFITKETERKETKNKIITDSQDEFKTVMVIDRLDQTPDGKYRVVDYKSGRKENLRITDIENVFRPGVNRKDKEPLLQTMFYGINFEGKRWVPAIYSLPRLPNNEFSPYPDNDTSAINKDLFESYKKQLHLLLEEIADADPDKIFTPCESSDYSTCSFCDYKSLCGR